MQCGRAVRVAKLLGIEEPHPGPLAGAQDDERAVRAVAAQALELAAVDRARRQFGDADLGLAANRAEPAGNSRRIGGRGVEYRHRRDLPHAEFDKALERIDPVECEFLDPDFGAERHRFLSEPLGTGQIARCSGAVQTLAVPRPQP